MTNQVRIYDLKSYELSDTVRWSGKGPVPAIGSKVRVTMNGLGEGTVEGYFIESTFLGIYVKLSNPPAWWVKQTAGKTFGRKTGCAMVFGAEIAAPKPIIFVTITIINPDGTLHIATTGPLPSSPAGMVNQPGLVGVYFREWVLEGGRS